MIYDLGLVVFREFNAENLKNLPVWLAFCVSNNSSWTSTSHLSTVSMYSSQSSSHREYLVGDSVAG